MSSLGGSAKFQCMLSIPVERRAIRLVEEHAGDVNLVRVAAYGKPNVSTVFVGITVLPAVDAVSERTASDRALGLVEEQLFTPIGRQRHRTPLHRYPATPGHPPSPNCRWSRPADSS